MQFVFDFNNLALINMHIPEIKITENNPNWGLWHYTMFIRIHDFVMDTLIAKSQAKAMVYLARDMRSPSWRAQIYPPYKGNRVKAQNIDWEQVAVQMDVFHDKVKKYLPWKTIMVRDAEADDIIAVLAKEGEASNKQTIIYSTDADYMQLCSELTQVYRPHSKEYAGFPGTVKIAGSPIHCETKEDFLLLSILTGQGRKDNVFNIKTDSDWVPTEDCKRMTPFGVVAAKKVVEAPEGMQAALQKMGCYDNYLRNKLLIDFNQIPTPIRDKINKEVTEINSAPQTVNINGFIDDTFPIADKSVLADYIDLYEEIFIMETTNPEVTPTTPEAPTPAPPITPVPGVSDVIFMVYIVFKDENGEEYSALGGSFAKREHAEQYVDPAGNPVVVAEQELLLVPFSEAESLRKQGLIESALAKLTDAEKFALGLMAQPALPLAA